MSKAICRTVKDFRNNMSGYTCSTYLSYLKYKEYERAKGYVSALYITSIIDATLFDFLYDYVTYKEYKSDTMIKRAKIRYKETLGRV